MIEPGTHSGQVGQPSPEDVTRTKAPVTTIAACATKLARRITSCKRVKVGVTAQAYFVSGEPNTRDFRPISGISGNTQQ